MGEESPLEKLRRLKGEESGQAARPAAGAPSKASIRRGGIGAVVVAVLIFAATKGKLILLFLLTKGKLLFGALKVGPLLTTFSTMAVSAWFYAGYFGAYLAVGLVVLILVHELGHGAAAKAVHLKVGAPVFVPFFGALIALKEQPRSTWVEAVVGFGGPLFGLIGAAAVLATGLVLPPGHTRDLMIVLAWFTGLINLFNLVPVFGLDGDRISQPFRPWYWLPGILLLVALLALEVDRVGRPNPFLLFVILLGALKGGRIWWKERRGDEGEGRLVDRLQARERYAEESDVRPWQRRAAAIGYFALVGLLTMLVVYASLIRPPVLT